MERVLILILAGISLSPPIMAQQTSPVHAVEMKWGKCRGVFSDNTRDDGKNGLVELYYADHPTVDLLAWGGLNMEHMFTGNLADDAKSGEFGPRMEPCVLTAESPQRVSLHWPAGVQAWNADCTLTFTGTDDGYLDFSFEMLFTRDFWSNPRLKPPLAGVLFASYMGVNRERAMYFYGMQGKRRDWVEFRGDDGDAPNIRVYGSPYFECENGSRSIVMTRANRNKKYLLPLYYGLLDGDGNRETAEDTMMYLLMFDRSDTIQFGFAQWNNGVRGPALDWEFIVSDPAVNTPYRFNARLVIKPFRGREDVLVEYAKWRGLGELLRRGFK
jgi:hypothetical protein